VGHPGRLPGPGRLGPAVYSNSADFSRYLPRATRPASVAGWTALGGFVPSVAFTALGALAGTALDMTDPQSALGGILPGWFRPAFRLAVVLCTIANNAMTAYSSGLAPQAVGVRIRRSRSVAIDGTLGVALTPYALLVSNFLDTVAACSRSWWPCSAPAWPSTPPTSCCAATATTAAT
jgi:nucleobase:cation symporter-1, NCS1 family